ncbi:MAG: efflux RND transporter periplasmic adaptor subunit [Hyphomicrobiaceae bacterium]
MRSFFLALLAILVGAGGYAVWHYELWKQVYPMQTAASPSSGTPAAAKAPLLPVEASTAETGPVVSSIEALGTLQADQQVVIASEIAGKVVEARFTEGRPIKTGAVVVQLDASTLEATLAQAKADLDLAEVNFARAKSLADKRLGSQANRDEAEGGLATATARLALARAQLAKATIRAPIDGVLGLSTVGIGDYLTPGQAIVTITSIDPVKVEFRVPEVFLSVLKPGLAIDVTVDAFPGRAFKGEVTAIDPVVDVNGRAVRMKASLPNPDGTLKPGLFARVKLVLSVVEAAVLIPEAAIIPEGDKSYVFVLEGRTVRKTEVVAGQRQDGRVEIKEGLTAGQRVITAGQMRLKDGDEVTEMPGKAA